MFVSYDLFNILLLPLQIYGSMECMYVCKSKFVFSIAVYHKPYYVTYVT